MDLETLDWDDELLGVLRHPAGDAAGDPAVVRPEPATARPAPTARSAARSRSPATSATSRRPPSARSASRRARPRTPTAPATSCCSTPAPSWSARATACSPRSATSSATSAPVYALEGSIAVTGSAVQWLRDQLGIISGAAESETLARAGRGQRRRLLRAGVLRAVRAVLALRRARRDRRAVPLQHQRAPRAGHAGGDLLPEPRRRRGDGAGLRRRASTCSRSTAASPPTSCACRSRPTCSACRSAGRSSPRPRRSARRTRPGWRSGFWSDTDELRAELERGQALGARAGTTSSATTGYARLEEGRRAHARLGRRRLTDASTARPTDERHRR